MPKLNKATAKKVDAAKSDFEPLPDGAYHVRLRDVDGSKPEGPKGPYWVWEFEVCEEGEYANRRLWTNTSLSEAAFFKMKEAYDAFGVPTDTDTDELLGQVCKAITSVRTIQQGTRKGELTNQIEKLVPRDEDYEPPEDKPPAGAGSDDDIPF